MKVSELDINEVIFKKNESQYQKRRRRRKKKKNSMNSTLACICIKLNSVLHGFNGCG